MNPTVLGTAVALSHLHGVFCAASFLCEQGVNIDVAVELLAGVQRPHDNAQAAPHLALDAAAQSVPHKRRVYLALTQDVEGSA